MRHYQGLRAPIWRRLPRVDRRVRRDGALPVPVDEQMTNGIVAVECEVAGAAVVLESGEQGTDALDRELTL